MGNVWDVGCLPGCGMLIYEMPFLRELKCFKNTKILCHNSGFLFSSAKNTKMSHF